MRENEREGEECERARERMREKMCVNERERDQVCRSNRLKQLG